MNISQAIATELKMNGIQCVFGLLGEDIVGLAAELDRIGIDCYWARHENQAVAMADGYSRAGGGIGVAMVTGGPGFSNSITALNTAHRANSRVLLIVGANRDTIGNKAFPHQAICEALGIPVVIPADAETALSNLRSTVSLVYQRTTVVLNVGIDILEHHIVPGGWSPSEVSRLASRQAVPPDPDDIERIAGFLDESWAIKRPVILAGRGAVESEAISALSRLADLTGALLATTLPAIASFQGSPWNIGVCGTYSTAIATELLHQADCLMAFGASLTKFTSVQKTLFPHAHVIQIDSDSDAFGRFIDVDPELTVLADARLAAEALIAELETRPRTSPGYRSHDVFDRLAAFDRHGDTSPVTSSGLIHPQALASHLDQLLPQDRIFVVDTGHHATFAIPGIQVPSNSSFMQVNNAGSIGLSLGAGIGAAIARPDATTIIGVGDAGFLMALGDLDTAVRYQIPLIIIVNNDNGLGAEVQYMRLRGMDSVPLARYPTPPIAKLADALGAEGYTVLSISELNELEGLFTAKRFGPMVLDCLIDPDIMSDSMAIVFPGEQVKGG